MDRRFAWLGGAVGALVGWRWLRRKHSTPPEPVQDPADTLRAKLDESRALVDERDAFEEGEMPVDQADPGARRRSVHEQARARLDELRGE
jgi:hypothetical protein